MDIRYRLYRWFMIFIHKHKYHKMDVSFPEGDTRYCCRWCGLSVVLKRDMFAGMKIVEDKNIPPNTIILTNLRIPK
jgi:hypothetical protein